MTTQLDVEGELLAAIPGFLARVSDSGCLLDFRGNAPSIVAAHFVHPLAQCVGKALEDALVPAVANEWRAALAQVIKTGRAEQLVYELSPTQPPVNFEAQVIPLPRQEALVVVRDITALRRREEELVAAREVALERSLAKTQFLAHMSHEIRNPLNAILGVAELLRQQALPTEAGELVDILRGAGESLLAIVNDVLDLSKIEANHLELESQPFDLEQVVTEATRSFLGMAQQKSLALRVEFEPGARGQVLGDPARLRQIVNNLVSNAVKFTELGSVRVTVARYEGDRVRICVIDTGPGIEPEQQGRIFEAFQQAQVGSRHRAGGTGLGLTISRRIALLMRGDLQVTSALHQGATFTLEVLLPRLNQVSTAAPKSSPSPVPLAMRVLLAEDDPVNAAMTAALLRKMGHQVQVVHNGADCVAEVQKGEVDLVLMDVHMPQLDGLAATRQIRERERGTPWHVPIVALTANAMKGDDVICLSAGMDAYLAKPASYAALKDLLVWFGGRPS